MDRIKATMKDWVRQGQDGPLFYIVIIIIALLAGVIATMEKSEASEYPIEVIGDAGVPYEGADFSITRDRFRNAYLITK